MLVLKVKLAMYNTQEPTAGTLFVSVGNFCYHHQKSCTLTVSSGFLFSCHLVSFGSFLAAQTEWCRVQGRRNNSPNYCLMHVFLHHDACGSLLFCVFLCGVAFPMVLSNQYCSSAIFTQTSLVWEASSILVACENLDFLSDSLKIGGLSDSLKQMTFGFLLDLLYAYACANLNIFWNLHGCLLDVFWNFAWM